MPGFSGEKNYDHDTNYTIFTNANTLLRRFSKSYIYVKCYLFLMYCSSLYCVSFWFDSRQQFNNLRLLVIIDDYGKI